MCRTCAVLSKGCDTMSYLRRVLKGYDIMSYLYCVLKGVRHRVVSAPHPQGGTTSCRTCAASPRGYDIVSYLCCVLKVVRHRVVPALRSQGVRHHVVPVLRPQGGTTSCRTCAAFSKGCDIVSYLRRVLRGVRHHVVLALVSNPKGIR